MLPALALEDQLLDGARQRRLEATTGSRRRARGFGAFFVVHMTSWAPFQVKAIGMTRGAPSVAT